MSALRYECAHERLSIVAGVRERKKAERRARILAVAEERFATKGYAATTVAEVAEGADVGEGTIFNYFASKAEILVATMRRAFLPEPPEAGVSIAMEGDVVDGIVSFLDHYLRPARSMNKRLLREVFAITFRYSGESPYVLAELVEMDRAIGRELYGHLLGLQERGRVPADADVSGFLQLGYAVVMLEFSRFVTSDDADYDAMLDALRVKLGLLARGVLLRPDAATTGTTSKGVAEK